MRSFLWCFWRLFLHECRERDAESASAREREGSECAVVVWRTRTGNECSTTTTLCRRNETNRIALVVVVFFFFFADGKLFGARFRAVVCFDRSCSFALAHDREPLSPSPRRRGGMKGRKLRCERAPLTISFFLSLRAIEKSSVSPPLSTSHPRFLFFPLLFSTAPLRRLRALPLRPQPLDGHQPQQHGQDA